MLTQSTVAAPERLDNLRGLIDLEAVRDEPDPRVVVVVRRALNQQAEILPVTRRVHALARRLAGPDWMLQVADREQLVRQVARALGG